MGCLKLTYYQQRPRMRCVWGKKRQKKSVQWFYMIDPLAEKYYNISPYAYVANNPLKFIDPTRMAIDWIYDTETEEYVWDGTVTQASETPTGYEYVGSSLQDTGNHFVANNLGAWPFPSFSGPKFGENRTPWPGEILPMEPLSHFEMWLGSPSESIGEGVGKIAMNVLYSFFNSPYSLVMGRTNHSRQHGKSRGGFS